MNNCVFCKIISREIPAIIVYEDETMMVFKDLNPVAPIHLLIVPKTHMASLNDVSTENEKIIAIIMGKIKHIAEENGISEGYRLVSNCGAQAGQTVEHLHFHLMGGRPMLWPPG